MWKNNIKLHFPKVFADQITEKEIMIKKITKDLKKSQLENRLFKSYFDAYRKVTNMIDEDNQRKGVFK